MSLARVSPLDLAFHWRHMRYELRCAWRDAKRLASPRRWRWALRSLWFDVRYSPTAAVLESALFTLKHRWRKAMDSVTWEAALLAFRVRQLLTPTELERFRAACRVYRDKSANHDVDYATALACGRAVITASFAGYLRGEDYRSTAPLSGFIRAAAAYAASDGATEDKAQAVLRVVFRAPSPADVAAGAVV